jgi:uracil-DNA glycosylase family 4
MLQLLDKKVGSCRECDLNVNKCLIPYWCSDAKYIIISESPSFREIRDGVPFSGQTGDILTRQLHDVGFKAKDFLFINSVQCGKGFGIRERSNHPTEDQLTACQNILRKYIKVVNPEKILCLGNYAKYIFTGDTTGVLKYRLKRFQNFKIDSYEFPVLCTIHPAYCIHNPDGIPMLEEDLRLFKNSEFERESSWLFTEEEFLIF